MVALDMSHPPSDFCCPLTGQIMKDPVSTPRDVVYERSAIIDYIRRTHMCPVTATRLAVKDLVSNTSLKMKIEYWQQKETPKNCPEQTEKKTPNSVVPRRFICPLTHQVFLDPVLTKYENVFERYALVDFVTKLGVDPISGKPLAMRDFYGYPKLAQEIHIWFHADPELEIPPVSIPLEESPVMELTGGDAQEVKSTPSTTKNIVDDEKPTHNTVIRIEPSGNPLSKHVDPQFASQNTLDLLEAAQQTMAGLAA